MHTQQYHLLSIIYIYYIMLFVQLGTLLNQNPLYCLKTIIHKYYSVNI